MSELTAQIARSRSDSETLATFRAAPGKDLTTRSRGHAGAKAVSALTMQIAGLVGTLHTGSCSCVSDEFFRRRATESCVKTSTCRGGKKGGKGTQRLPQCQAQSRSRAVREIARSGCG